MDPEHPEAGPEEAAVSPRRYRFGRFQLDVVARTLSGDGEEIRLAPRIFVLLQYLVAHAGEACSREDLLDHVWEGVVVSDQSLTEAVWRLRRALDDEPKTPRYIATIPGHGFRFVADVTVDDETAQTGAVVSPRLPLWKLALPGAILSGLLLAVLLAGAFLEAGPTTPVRPALRALMADEDFQIVDPAAQLSPDASSIVFARSDPPRLRVLDIPSGETIELGDLARSWNGRSYAWSNDGAWIALGDRPERGGAGRIELFAADGTSRDRIVEHRMELYIVAGWSPDGDRLLTQVGREREGGGRDFLIRLLDRSGGVLGEWELQDDAEGRVSPDGRWLALARVTDDGGEIVIVPIEGIWTRPEEISRDRFLDLERWGRVTDPPCAGDAPHWGPASDRLIFFTFRAGTRELWTVDLEEGRPLGQAEPLRVPGSPFTIVGWAPNGNVAFCSLRTVHDVAVVEVDPETAEVTGQPERLTIWRGRARSPAWSRDPDRLLFLADGRAHIASLGGGDGDGPRSVGIERRHRVPVWSPDGAKVYFASWLEDQLGQGLFEYDVETGQERRILPEETLFAPTPRLAAGGRLLLFNNADRTPYPRLHDVITRTKGLFLHDLDSGDLIQLDDTTQSAATISEDGARVAFVDDDRTALWLLSVENPEDRRVVHRVDGIWRMQSPPAFSPDGERLAFIRYRDAAEGFCPQQQLWILDLNTGVAAKLDALDELGVNDVAWSPDGGKLAIGLHDCRSGVFLYEQ